MQFEGNRFCFNKQQRNTNIHILGFFEASKLMGILCLTESLTRTSVVRWRKKHLSSKTSLQITNILDRGPDSTKNLISQKVIFFKKRRFPSPKLDPPDPNGHIPCIQMAQGPDSQRRWRASFETWYKWILPCRFVDFFDFLARKKKNSPIYFTYRVDQFSFLNFWGG